MFHVDWFWLFILGVSVAGVVSGIIRSADREKTIRAAIDKGVALDPATLEALRNAAANPPSNPRFGLLVGSIMTFAVGCGLMLLGYFIGMDETTSNSLHPLLGVGALLWCISLGLFVASRFAPAPRTP
ncbi:MAG: hypothetical protein WDN01_13660 [Rhizomicrobium sp.]